jgi:hypothetical protein
MTSSESMRGKCACESEIDDLLDRAELALRRSYGRRRESETSFLQHMLRDLGSPAYRAGLSPAREKVASSTQGACHFIWLLFSLSH